MPQSKKNQRATGQKYRLDSTCRTPWINDIFGSAAAAAPASAISGGRPALSGRSRTINQLASTTTSVIPPMISKETRHPSRMVITASSQVAAITPIPPTALRIPAMNANSRGQNHWDRIFMVGIKTMAAPKPTRMRPINAVSRLGENPKSTLPNAAIIREKVTVFRGPTESARRPAGSCMTA